MNAILPKLSRRAFVVSAAGAGLALGFHLPLGGKGAAQASTGASEVNAWVVIAPDDSVTIRVARSEMGQGTQTGLCQIVAEELECDWSKVKPEFASTNEHIRRKRVWGSMSTGGSQGIRGSQSYVRQAGAAAREMLVAAAAARWKVPASECRAAASVITHSPTGRRLRFGEVAAEAAKLEPPKDVKLKDPKDWKIAGKPVARFDVPDKVMGKPVYGIDVRLPNMVYAAIKHCPVFGGNVKSFDEAAIKGRKGVVTALSLGNAVVAVADTYWRAKQAVDALPVVWDDQANKAVSDESIAAFVKAGLDAGDVPPARNDGDAKAELGKAGKIITADYGVPFQNHAQMEPMNATAIVTQDRVEVWVATQNSEASAAAAAAASGMPLERIEIHKVMLGGGFGRRGGSQEPTTQAVRIAKAIGRPVQLIWSREEDMQHGRYRPVTMARMRAVLGPDGMPTAWWTRISGQSIIYSFNPSAIRNGVDLHTLGGLHDMAYGVPNVLVDYAMRNTHVPSGFWRGVKSNENGFYRESFVDEMAAAASADTYQFRRKLLQGPKAKLDLAVLDAAAKKAEWEKPSPAGRHRGIAVYASYGSYSAAVVEISMVGNEVKVERVVYALDCGHVVNPTSCETQIEGAVAWALTATLFGEITIKDGRVEQSNFHDYPMLRIDRMPKVEVMLVPSGGFWGGVGEPGVSVIAPALCNAIFAATGKRIRSLPLLKHGLVKV